MSGYALIAALLYFSAYVPFAYCSGKYPDMPALSACAVIICMCILWTVLRLWGLIYLNRYTILSGACTAGIIGTTIAALAYKGVSVFKVSLITRGAVLLLAPISDYISKNRITRQAVIASALSAAALVLMHLHKFNGDDADMPADLAGILAVYVLCYGIKLPIFSAPKRTDTRNAFLVSEQTVAVSLYSLFTFIKYGVPQTLLPAPIVIGVFSQLTGIFGGAILISPREHTAAVPLNRAASMTAGFVGSVLLGQKIHNGQIAGFLLLLTAVMVLIPQTNRR